MRILFCLFLMVQFGLRAANPSFTDFNTNQFGTTGNKVVIKDGASITNANLVGYTLGVSSLATSNLTVGGTASISDLIVTNTLALNVLNAGTLNSGTFTVTTNMGVGVTAVTGQPLTIQRAAVGTTPTGTLFLTNNTAAALGAQQYSPSIYLSGHGWSTTSSADSPVTFRTYVIPIQGAAFPTATLNFQSSISNGTFGGTVTIDSAGSITSPGNLVSGSGSHIDVGSRSRMFSSADGAMEFNISTSSRRSTVQADIPHIAKTANYAMTALDSGLTFNNVGAAATNRVDLPTAALGMQVRFYQDANFLMRVQATGSDIIRDAAVDSPAAGGISLNAVGTTLHLICSKVGIWVVHGKNGTLVGPN